ncbi:hypothetical protein [Apilactobacillus xinyiensis]|uniref:hypothetical protein n=1 Tax=Apilactobacillus xinyiensis TaxID=2841032 RepID=UPI001C7D3584|nr:hypothetical protein [Apilactobacillus xinyiensis]MCL0319190.1 hypothetical protein [Apilactobacillus xinyiensis]
MLFKIIFGTLGGAIGLIVAAIEGAFFIACFIILFQILSQIGFWGWALRGILIVIAFILMYKFLGFLFDSEEEKQARKKKSS